MGEQRVGEQNFLYSWSATCRVEGRASKKGAEDIFTAPATGTADREFMREFTGLLAMCAPSRRAIAVGN
jgi:hypothetical protein